jgi:hypothetical protein
MLYPGTQPCHATLRAKIFWTSQPARLLLEPEMVRCRQLPWPPSRSNLHSASLLHAVSFFGGFQTPAGPGKTPAHPATI